jgi:PadR family transcriptional regulator, regulatory protein PadR
MPRRRAGALVALEVEILSVLADHAESVHGFQLARLVAGDKGALTAHGTLYKALSRLTTAGLLVDEWEATDLARSEGRPRRRYYRITDGGRLAVAQHHTETARATSPVLPGRVSPA